MRPSPWIRPAFCASPGQPAAFALGILSPYGARGSPLPPFPASSGPREEGPPWAWGWVLGGKERTPAASALPALLCQPGGDLLGGPESFEGSIKVNLLLPGPRLGVCSPRLLGPQPSLTKPQPSCTRTFSPPLPTPPLPPSTPRICVCGFIYLPAPRMGAGAPRLRAKGAGRWRGRWLGLRVLGSRLRTHAQRPLEPGPATWRWVRWLRGAGAGRREGGMRPRPPSSSSPLPSATVKACE